MINFNDTEKILFDIMKMFDRMNKQSERKLKLNKLKIYDYKKFKH